MQTTLYLFIIVCTNSTLDQNISIVRYTVLHRLGEEKEDHGVFDVYIDPIQKLRKWRKMSSSFPVPILFGLVLDLLCAFLRYVWVEIFAETCQLWLIILPCTQLSKGTSKTSQNKLQDCKMDAFMLSAVAFLGKSKPIAKVF